MRYPVRLVCLALLALLALGTAATGAAAHPRRPTNRDQPLKDGCQRPTFVNLTFVRSPEWVYVNRNPAVQTADGITRIPHTALADQPGTHTWFDFNANLVPDAGSRWTVAGSPTAGTNNYGGSSDEPDSSEERGRLHYEWEEGSLPKFAWPSDGDRTRLWGSWIWDCGHPNTGTRLTGERSEFHPLNAIAVTRSNPSRARAGESETDAYLSSDGTYAHATLECARKMTPQPDGTYGPNFFDCARDPKNFRQKLAKTYRFTVRAPRRPAGATKLVLRTRRVVRKGSVAEQVRRTSTGFAVTLRPHSKNVRWGKSYFARWVGRRPASTRLVVTLKQLLVKHADPDASEGGVDPAGEKWALYLEVNGQWTLVNDWAPSLYRAQDNMRIALNRKLNVVVQGRRGLHLFMMGRECDGPSGVVIAGIDVPRTKPCPFNRTESKISERNNDDPGTVFDRYATAGAALGTHRTKSRPTVFFPHSGPITFGDGKQGKDAYEITYSVHRR